MAAERVLHLVALVLAHQSVVHKDAGELVSHRLVGQEGGDGRVHPAGEAADHAVVSYLGPDALDGFLDDRHGRPGRRDVADLVEEVLEDILTVRGMPHLGVELHAIQPAGLVFHRGHRHVRTTGRGREARRDLDHGVAVAHPAGEFGGNTREQSPLLGDGERPAAVLGEFGPLDPSPAQLGYQLEPVADAQDGHAQFEEIADRAVGRRPD